MIAVRAIESGTGAPKLLFILSTIFPHVFFQFDKYFFHLDTFFLYIDEPIC